MPGTTAPNLKGDTVPADREPEFTEDDSADAPDDLMLRQYSALTQLSELCETLKKSDVRAYGKFVKSVRQILGDKPIGTSEKDNPWLDAAGIMKDSPAWPEISQIIDNSRHSQV